MNKDNIQIGDKVFVIEKWSDAVIMGTVEECSHPDYVKIHNACFVDRNGQACGKTYGTSNISYAHLYKTADAAWKTLDQINNKVIKSYQQSIKTIQDLVEFPLDHCLIGEEYTDWQAIQVYKDKCKELLGINL